MRKSPFLLLLFCSLSFAAPTPNQLAADAGKALGQTQDALITPQINQVNVNTKIPHVTGNPSETQFFGGGKADNYTPGNDKRIACDTGAKNPDPFTQQSCDAVNLIAKGPSQRPQFTIDRNDPMLQREQWVRSNAPSIACGASSNNPNGFCIPGTYTDCTTTTTEDPNTWELKTCTDYISTALDTVENQCQKSVATMQTCNQVMSFTVSIPQPIPATPNYSCPIGQTLSGTNCIKPAIAAQVNYSCSAGSTLSGSTCQPAPSTATASYSCGSGSTLTGTTCVTPTVNATLTYSCPSGAALSGAVCIPAATSATVTYTCPTGSTLTGTNCQAPSYQPAGINATAAYVYYGYDVVFSGSSVTVSINPAYQCHSGGCNSDYYPMTLNYVSGTNATATQTLARNYQGYWFATTTISYIAATNSIHIQSVDWPLSSCPTGFNLQSVQIVLTYTDVCVPAPSCPANTTPYKIKNGLTFVADVCAPAPSCPIDTSIQKIKVGLTNVDVCGPADYIVVPLPLYTCPAGYTLSGTTCYPPRVTPPPTPATASYSCASGNTLSGTICQAPSYSATSGYTCSAGATLGGTLCYTPTVSATISYSCPTGNTLYGSLCYPPPVGATVSYTCPAGGSLVGTMCQPPATAAIITYTCAPGTTLSGTTCILAPLATETFTDNCTTFQSKTLVP